MPKIMQITKVERKIKEWEERWVHSQHPKRDYWMAYTFFFLVCFSVIALGFAVMGKGFVFSGRMGDGLRQHYVSLAYFGNYLREFFRNLLIEHEFSLPMWDMSIGYGTDILTTLHYYTIGDPLNLLSVFVPERFTEYLYDFLIVLRMYLAGITFSCYCFYHKNKRFATLLGAILYAFAQWIMVAGFRHPFFINPCIYFPLLLLGIDMVYKKEKQYFLVIVMAISCMSNFYYFYMLGIFTVIYAVYRYFMIFKKVRIKETLQWLGRFAVLCVIAMLLSAVIFLPCIMALFGTDRVGAENYIQTFYKTKYYHMLLPALFGKFQAHYTVIGTSAISFLGLLVLFSKRKRGTELKIGFLMCMGFLLIPFIAHVFNGFSYVSNRWNWVLVMLISYIFVKVYPEIFALTRKRRIGIFSCLVVLAIYIVLDKYASHPWNLCGIGILLAVCGLLFWKYDYFSMRKAMTGSLLLGAVLLGTFVNIYFSFTDSGNPDSGVWKFADFGTAYESTVGTEMETICKLPDIQQYRYEQGGTGITQNANMLSGLMGGQFFFSLANGNVSRFLDELYSNKPLEQNYQDQNGRSFLMKLLSMKYFIGKEIYAPYGYEKIGETLTNDELIEDEKNIDSEEESETSNLAEETDTIGQQVVGIYEDKNALPLAYTYDSYIPREIYEKMGVMEKQQALLQGVVLEESELPQCDPEDTSVEVPYKITQLENCELFKNRIKAKEAGASCVLEFQGVPNSELYVAFDNLEYLEVNRRHKYSDEEWNALSFGEKRKIQIKDEKIETQVNISMDALLDGKDVCKSIRMVTNKNNFYNGRHNFMNHIGYSKEVVTQIKLVFDQKGSYRYEDMSIYCQPMDRLETYTEQRQTKEVKELSFDTNKIDCTVELTGDKAVLFSVPYSKGWKVMVDGKEGTLKKANTMFMAVELEEGKHHIVFSYTTPYIIHGLICTCVGIVLLIALVVACRRKRKRNQK